MVILLIIPFVIICILIIFLSINIIKQNRTDQPVITQSSTNIVDTALKRADITPLNETFVNTDVKFNDLKIIMNNYEEFMNIYCPQVDFNKLNQKMKDYGFKSTINQITTANSENIKLQQNLIGSAFSLIYIDYSEDETIRKLNIIPIALMYKLIIHKDEDITLKYDYNNNNVLNIYIITPDNKNKKPKIQNIFQNDFLFNFDNVCKTDNICYINSTMYIDYREQVNSINNLKNNSNYIEEYKYLIILNAVKEFDVLNANIAKIDNDLKTIEDKLTNNGIQLYK